MQTYACYYKCDNIRFHSSSGGIFSLLAQQFEVVYGVAMTEDCYGAEFVRVENDIAPLRGSKYLQAKVGDAYKQAKQDLLDGRRVLFTGTPCQINGLYAFWGKVYYNLYCMDIICHGVPKPALRKQYIEWLEKQTVKKVTGVNFRSKEKTGAGTSQDDSEKDS